MLTTVEDFNRGPGLLPASGTWNVGGFTVTASTPPSTAAYLNVDQYGGAGGTGQYLSPKNAVISVTLTGDRKYVGFWWSAGDASNRIRFYDADNNLLTEFTTASLVSLLSGAGYITAIDGSQYLKSDYYGNPNPPPGRVTNEPFAFINLSLEGTSLRFARIEIQGTNFELDNITVANAIQVDTAWVDYGKQPIALPASAVGASPDVVATPVNTPVSGNAAANDQAPVGSTWSAVTPPSSGTLTLDADGTYTYAPNPNFVGVDTATYQVCKPTPNNAECAETTIRITVGLDAVDDHASATPGTPIQAAVPNNDLFPSGTTFSVSAAPSKGVLLFNTATGSYTYTPSSSYTGTDTFEYRLCLPAPNNTQCDTARVTLTYASNLAPTASNVAISAPPNVGVELTGTYTYGDTENDSEGASTFRWVRHDVPTSPAGGFTVGTGNTYTPVSADMGNYLFFCVTPAAAAGTTPGAEVCVPARAAGGSGTPTVVGPSLNTHGVPTLSEWAMLFMTSLMGLAAVVAIRQRS